jgi:hypothetical protein
MVLLCPFIYSFLNFIFTAGIVIYVYKSNTIHNSIWTVWRQKGAHLPHITHATAGVGTEILYEGVLVYLDPRVFH